MDNHVSEAMRNGKQVTIDVGYQNIDGYHVFTSEDVYGLYVASKDARKAFDGIAPALETMLELNYDLPGCEVEPIEDFSEFLKSRWPTLPEKEVGDRPAILKDHGYLMRCAA